MDVSYAVDFTINSGGRRLLDEGEQKVDDCQDDYVTLKEPLVADPYVMARKPVIKSYEPLLERGNAKCPMKCEAEASGPAYEQNSRIFAHFNHLTGEAKVLAANN